MSRQPCPATDIAWHLPLLPLLQWIDKEDDIQAAIEACPVSCIHWVTKDDLPALEFVTQNKVGCRWPRRLVVQHGICPAACQCTAYLNASPCTPR